MSGGVIILIFLSSTLKSWINEIANLNIDSGYTNSLTQTLSGYNSSVTSIIINTMRTSSYVIGASLLTLFMLMELVAMVNRSSGSEQGLGSIKLPANIMIKFAIFAFCYTHIPTILNAIQDIAANFAVGLSYSDGYSVGVGLSASQVDAVCNEISNLDFLDKIFTYVTVLLAYCVIKLVKGLLTITIILRVFELWLLLMYAPIPLSTIVSPELRQTAINFLKTFIAVSMQGGAIIACFLIYRALMTSSFIALYDGSVNVNDYISTFLMNNIMAALALAISVLTSGKLVRQIMNAM